MLFRSKKASTEQLLEEVGELFAAARESGDPGVERELLAARHRAGLALLERPTAADPAFAEPDFDALPDGPLPEIERGRADPGSGPRRDAAQRLPADPRPDRRARRAAPADGDRRAPTSRAARAATPTSRSSRSRSSATGCCSTATWSAPTAGAGCGRPTRPTPRWRCSTRSTGPGCSRWPRATWASARRSRSTRACCAASSRRRPATGRRRAPGTRTARSSARCAR